jgi:surface polysaccharide O-acyltransferase-like enzyme
MINKPYNATVDIVKLVFAFFVVGIHTQPFGFSLWLDRGFGIITRMCVPFYFVASSYFFFSKNGSPLKYISRLAKLYIVWSILYYPFHFEIFKTTPVLKILERVFWTGETHVHLWYLLGSIIGFAITYALSKVLKPKYVFIIGMVFLLIGCLKSTYAPIFNKLFSINITDFMGSRNGLFYGFPYYSLGLIIAKTDPANFKSRRVNIIGFIASLCFLILESVVIVLLFGGAATVLWISVFPMTYFFFVTLKQTEIKLPYKTSIMIRKLSTMVYVSHCWFLNILPGLTYWKSFIVVSLITTIFSFVVIYLSEKRPFKWLHLLY